SQSKHAEEIDALIQVEGALGRIGKDAARAECLQRLGGIYSDQGQYADAEECYLLSQTIFSSLDDTRSEATLLSSLGVLYGRQDQYAESAEYFAQARIAYALASDLEGEAKALDALTATNVVLNRFGDAKVACMEACEIYMRMGQPLSRICGSIWESLQAGIFES
ncbi:hypothetical protein FRC01_009172, partial [Tulasnella sp. 417]